MNSKKTLTQRDILRFWMPLFGSWLLLTMEGPFISTVVNRLADPVIMLASAGIVIGLSVFIESPIINILATTTAKVEDWESYVLVRRFTLHLSVLLTIIHMLFAFTPLFDWVVVRLMGVSAEIAAWVQMGMRIMILWSAAIAWRRFLQGVLIRFGRTNTIVVGTAIRLFGGISVALLLIWLTDLPGIIIACCVWMTGVTLEAIYSTIAVRPVLANELAPSNPTTSNLTYKELFLFHLPLASTSVLTLLIQPLAAYALARLANPINSLAAWPILFQLLLVGRATALATPEVIIALNKHEQARQSLQRFVWVLTLCTLAFSFIFVLSPMMPSYLYTIQNVVPEVGSLVASGLMICLVFPALNVYIFGLRGFLISQKTTRPVNTGMMLNITTNIAFLLIGVQLGWSGIITAVVALNFASLIEATYLWWQRRHAAQLAYQPV